MTAQTMHTQDTDCVPYLNADDGMTMQTCPVCGVGHGDACSDCGGRGFHDLRCPTMLNT